MRSFPAAQPFKTFYSYAEETMYLPQAVMMWAELDYVNPEVHRENGTVSLSGMNDGGCDFEEIANIIEENWPMEEVASAE